MIKCIHSGNTQRSLLIQLHPDIGMVFASASPDNWAGDLLPWEAVSVLNLIPNKMHRSMALQWPQQRNGYFLLQPLMLP